MMLRDIEIEQEGKLVTAHIGSAMLTHIDMQELMDTLHEKMRYDKAVDFILELSKVEFLSSACLGVMVTFLQELQTIRGRIALAACQDEVAFVFKVTKLDTIFSLHDDVVDAKEALTNIDARR